MSFASLGTSPGDAETTGPGTPLESHSLRQLLGESAKTNPRSFLSFFSRDTPSGGSRRDWTQATERSMEQADREHLLNLCQVPFLH